MREIPSDWSPDALLLFVGVFTALSAGASIFLAEILRFGKTGDSKSGNSSNANPFSGSKGLQKRLNQK